MKKLNSAALTMVRDRHIDHSIGRACDACALLEHVAALDADLDDLRVQRDATSKANAVVTDERDEARRALAERVAETYRLRAALEKCGADLDAVTSRAADQQLEIAALKAAEVDRPALEQLVHARMHIADRTWAALVAVCARAGVAL